MTETLRVAVYARISEDGTGEGAGVDRQVRDAEALAELRGWEVVERFHDNDISALRGRHRPGYEALLQAVARGAVDRVLVWQTSRLWRNRSERARDIDTFAEARVGIIAVKGPDLDLSTAYGRGMAGLLGEFDTMESEVKSERVAAAAADRARRGVPNGGLGYGWIKTEDGAWIVNEAEAAVVREVTDRLLAGESLHGITDDLNARGVPSPGSRENRRRATSNPNGTRWGRSSVKKIATRPANAAIRVHHRGKPTETMTDGQWPAIVPRDRWERIAARFAPDPGRTSTPRPGARKHLLSFSEVGACGVCGSHLRVKTMKPKKPTQSPQTLYACDAKSQCTGRNQAKVDDLVAAVVVGRLGQPDALAWLAGDDERAREAGERVEALQARLDGAADRYAEGGLDLAQLERITEKIKPQINAAERDRLAHLSTIDADRLAILAGPQARQSWNALNASQRHDLLLALGVRVKIDRAGRGPVFRPESVRVEWVRS
ncbi:recombinase family protein [Ornithinimicrobium faecis]|uniref:Recombinase family protein n=1 Tax=Ornithinimicrobium faecis TaxID=2934158 RepID=A0ABY4YP86_9MICO|nr:recombinase family protein [Ornithinimicrobium sp. HY1793]USQ78300.1 recombinase family protein [Ornithinimicrobium sp. HY1793]